jgi:hypothetical protein
MRRSGLTIAWRGTPALDDWVAYIVKSQSRKLILADRVSERKVRTLLSQLQDCRRRRWRSSPKASAPGMS